MERHKNDECCRPSPGPWTLKLDGLIRDANGNIIVVCYNFDDAEHIIGCVSSGLNRLGAPSKGHLPGLVTLLWDFIENGKSSYGLDFFALREMVRAHAATWEDQHLAIVDLQADKSRMAEALTDAERFIRGFEDDEHQEGVDELLAKVRMALPAGETDRKPSQAASDPHEALLLASSYIQYVKERNPKLHGEANGTPSIEQAIAEARGRAV